MRRMRFMRSIKLENLTKAISGGVIIKGISLIIPAGKFLLFLGRAVVERHAPPSDRGS
jgi:hypothetical protein